MVEIKSSENNPLDVTSNDLMNHVPTIDSEVRKLLRRLKHPQTFFGEDNSKRRERLIELIASDEDIRRLFINVIGGENEEVHEDDISYDDDDEEFYTPGDEDLLNFRRSVAKYSLNKAKLRISDQLDVFNSHDEMEIIKSRRLYNEGLKTFELQGSQTISNRFTSSVSFSNNDKLIACGSWDGKTYILDNELSHLNILKGHDEKIGGVCWSPIREDLLISCGNEGLINIYSNVETGKLPIQSIKAHDNNRITKIQFHPNGKNLVSCSFDTTWKCWDLETSKELYYQEGHTKELFTISHHKDGSLLASGGLDSIGRIWDLRTGKSIVALKGHIKGIYSMDWRYNGFELVTGGGDSSLKVWDIRNSRKPKINIASHSKLISDLKISKNDKFMVSSSYDGYLNLISCDSWLILKKFKNNEKLITCNIGNNDDRLITGGWDRSIKLYSL